MQEYLAQKYGLPGAFDPSSIAGLQLWLKADAGIGDSSFYGFDERGNTRVLVSPSGIISNSYLYDAYGQQLTTSGSTANTFRYGGAYGYVFDGLDRMDVRMRGYDPIAGRWLSRDPIGLESWDTNLYRYVLNNPANYVDPSGEVIPVVLLLAAAGASAFGWGSIAGQEVSHYREFGSLTFWGLNGGDIAISSSIGAASGWATPFVSGIGGIGAIGAVGSALQYILIQFNHPCNKITATGIVNSAALGGFTSLLFAKFLSCTPLGGYKKWQTAPGPFEKPLSPQELALRQSRNYQNEVENVLNPNALSGGLVAAGISNLPVPTDTPSK